jgi:hypothetical protein
MSRKRPDQPGTSIYAYAETVDKLAVLLNLMAEGGELRQYSRAEALDRAVDEAITVREKKSGKVADRA